MLRNALVSASSPTADLYLAWSCADLLASGRMVRIAPTVFRIRDTLIVLRHASRLVQLPAHRRLIYVIDDDLRAALDDVRLPKTYRWKIGTLDAPAARAFEQAADVIVTSSENLAERYRALLPGKRIELIHPAWEASAAPVAKERPRRLAYLGARSHAADFAFLLPVLEGLLSDVADLRLTVSGNQALPGRLRNDPRVEVVPALGWNDYRRMMAGRSFDIGLYPLLGDCDFNACRSMNKLLEYDQHGAAVIASRDWRAAKAAAEAERCLMVPNTPGDWRAAIAGMLKAPGMARRIAGTNRTAILREDGLARQRRTWAKLLEIPPPRVKPPDANGGIAVGAGGISK